MTMRKKILCFWLTTFLFYSGLSAHPHVFIDNHVTIVFDGKGLAGFQLRWLFDDMTSSGFIMDYDANGDGRLDGNEVKVLKAEAFDNLKNYNYMTSVSIDDRDFKVQYVKNFFAEVENGRLSYNFLIPCHVSAITDNKQIRLSVFDQEFFIDFTLNKMIGVREAESIDHRYRTQKDLKKTYYFGQLNPIEVVLDFKKR